MEFRIQKTLNRKPKKYYWEIVNERGRIIAASENYPSYSKCLRDVLYVALSAFPAKIIDNTKTEPAHLNPPIKIDTSELDDPEKDEFPEKTILDFLATSGERIGEPEPGVSLGDSY